MLSIQYRMLLSVSLYFLANEFIEIALLFICIKISKSILLKLIN